MNVREAADLMGANATSVSPKLFDKQIKDYSIDSRTVGAGELFLLSRKKTTPAPDLMVSLPKHIDSSATHSSVERLRLWHAWTMLVGILISRR